MGVTNLRFGSRDQPTRSKRSICLSALKAGATARTDRSCSLTETVAELALPAGVTRAQGLLFGHGTASGVKAVVADQVWGAALGAINGLTYGLVKDGVEFMPAAAVKMARSTVVRAAAADLARTRCDGAALTRAAWAARWSGLARLRRDAAKFATGYEIIDGW